MSRCSDQAHAASAFAAAISARGVEFVEQVVERRNVVVPFDHRRDRPQFRQDVRVQVPDRGRHRPVVRVDQQFLAWLCPANGPVARDPAATAVEIEDRIEAVVVALTNTLLTSSSRPQPVRAHIASEMPFGHVDQTVDVGRRVLYQHRRGRACPARGRYWRTRCRRLVDYRAGEGGRGS